ncbi:hypothetical protein BDV59DRAFT_172863 [Aspergillus ambiguus]|uniref:uncharacterized protein n=1 Tax=Aspergillus ambiguus TaxID=176160 RepID=UPI003CCC9486
MEIWPPGNSSPIHDHGNASAIIKALEGQNLCTYYSSLDIRGPDNEPQPIGSPVLLKKGDVT